MNMILVAAVLRPFFEVHWLALGDQKADTEWFVAEVGHQCDVRKQNQKSLLIPEHIFGFHQFKQNYF